MIYGFGNCFNLHIPKLQKCKLDPCNTYQIIFQNIKTNCIYVFKVRDLSINNLRYNFFIKVPDCFLTGEYNYFLISEDDWSSCEINSDIVKQTKQYVDKSSLIVNGMKVISNEKLIVLSSFKALLFSNGKSIMIEDDNLVSWLKSNDNSKEGYLYKDLDILNNGIFVYCKEEKIINEPNEYRTETKYKVYEG